MYTITYEYDESGRGLLKLYHKDILIQVCKAATGWPYSGSLARPVRIGSWFLFEESETTGDDWSIRLYSDDCGKVCLSTYILIKTDPKICKECIILDGKNTCFRNKVSMVLDKQIYIPIEVSHYIAAS